MVDEKYTKSVRAKRVEDLMNPEIRKNKRCY